MNNAVDVRLKQWGGAALLSLVLVLGGCFESISDESGNDDSDDNGEASNPADRDFGFRLINAAANQPGVDIFINEDQIAGNVRYTHASAYIQRDRDGEMLEGEVQIDIVETGGDLEDAQYTGTLDFSEDIKLTGIIRPDGDGYTVEWVDEHIEDSHAGTSALRFSHIVPDLGPVDIYVGVGSDMSVDEMDPTVANLEEGSVEEFIEFESDRPYRVMVTLAGESEVLLDTGAPGVTSVLHLGSGDQAHFFLFTLEADNFSGFYSMSNLSMRGLVQSREFTNPVVFEADDRLRVQAIHAIPDAGPVDVVVDGEVVHSELAYGEAGDGFIINSGEADIKLRHAGTTDVIHSMDSDFSFVMGGEYALVAGGSLDAGSTTWIPGRVSAAYRELEEDENRAFIHGVNAYYAYDESVDMVVNNAYVGGGFDLEFGEFRVHIPSVGVASSPDEVAYYEAGTFGLTDVLIVEREAELERVRSYTTILTGIYGNGESPEILIIENLMLD